MSGKDGEERHLFCAARRRGAPTYSLLGELEGALVGADAEKLDNAALVGRKASDFADKVVHKLVALAGLLQWGTVGGWGGRGRRRGRGGAGGGWQGRASNRQHHMGDKGCPSAAEQRRYVGVCFQQENHSDTRSQGAKATTRTKGSAQASQTLPCLPTEAADTTEAATAWLLGTNTRTRACAAGTAPTPGTKKRQIKRKKVALCLFFSNDRHNTTQTRRNTGCAEPRQ